MYTISAFAISPPYTLALVRPDAIVLLSINTVARPVQPANASAPMLLTDDGMFMLVKLLQFWNVSILIVVTPLGMLMLASFVHSANAASPIVFTLAGKFTLVKLLQP